MLPSNRWIALALVALVQVAIAQDLLPPVTPPVTPSVTPTTIQRAASFQYVENTLPLAAQTHEVIMVNGTSVLLISQMSNSVLIKSKVDDNGVVTDLGAFQIGQPTSRLHGLVNSEVYPGKVWATLQEDNLILLIDPKVDDMQAAPSIDQVVKVPEGPGKGPHYVGEYGDELWSTLQDSSHVLRISHVDDSDYTLYDAQQRPIFIAQHPVNKMYYTGQDNSAAVMKIDPITNTTTQFAIPETAGKTPVGMISGPNGIWFTLLGTNTTGTGTFGHIAADDTIKYHKLNSTWGQDASLLHLGLDPDIQNTRTIWLLTSSIVYQRALDAVIKVVFDEKYENIISEEVTALPTQRCWAHRIFLTNTTVFATELTASKVFAWSTLKNPGTV